MSSKEMKTLSPPYTQSLIILVNKVYIQLKKKKATKPLAPSSVTVQKQQALLPGSWGGYLSLRPGGTYNHRTSASMTRNKSPTEAWK